MPKRKVMSQDALDEFLNEATHKVHGMWMEAGGRKLNADEMYALNDALTFHFCDKRG